MIEAQLLDPAHCGYCGGVMEGVSPGEVIANSLARWCNCGRRKLAWLGGGYVLVHREGCDGVSCDCWSPAGGLGAGAAMVTPTGRRVGPHVDARASSDDPSG